MSDNNPLNREKVEYSEIIKLISSDKSAVGIDAQFTHAIIIEYLKQISSRLDRLENSLVK